MDLSNQIHLPNVSIRATIRISLQFQTHSKWVVEKDSHNVPEGGGRRGKKGSKLRIKFYYINHLTTDNRADRKSKLCINSLFYFWDKKA